jgi:hypothetical protein
MVGESRRILHGDVEIHIRASGWKQHHHHGDARYQGVRFHITYFPGTVQQGSLPPGCLEIALKPSLDVTPTFSLEAIDVTAYPHGARAAAPPCARELASWTVEEKQALLDAAGDERLRIKSERLQEAINERGPAQVLYEESLCALGYKHNKLPFRLLAQRVPLDVLLRETHGEVIRAYAILAGVSGLLPRDYRASWGQEARSFIRKTWDHWWPLEATWSARTLEADMWRTHYLRPPNHPRRRIMGAASLFAGIEQPAERLVELAREHPSSFARKAVGLITRTTGTFWDHHLSLGGSRQPRPVAIVGSSRARAIVVNVVTPWLAAIGETSPFEEGLLDTLPSEDENAIMRQAAFFLFGPDHPSSLYRTGRQRQGLIQIFHDFCLNDRSRCEGCRFPHLLKRHQGRLEI